MAASTSDKFRLASSSGRPVVTSLSLPKAAGATSASLTAATNWNTTTGVDYVMYRRQLNTTTNKYEEIAGTRVEGRATLSGTTLSNMTFDAGTEPASGYAADGNTVVMCAATSTWADDLVNGILVQHKQDGTHGAVTATSLTLTTPLASAYLADDAVTGAKLINGNVKTIQTGSATDWSSTGSTNTDKSAVSTIVYKGVNTATGGTDKVVTFPAAYTQIPHVMVCTASAGSVNCFTNLISTTLTTFTIRQITDTGGTGSERFNWESEGV
jgi:hypothetical protein